MKKFIKKIKEKENEDSKYEKPISFQYSYINS